MITRLGTYSQIKGSTQKIPCKVATTGNITLSSTQTIDSVSVVAGDRVLVWQQSTPANNGIYIVAAGSWTRAVDMSLDDDVFTGLGVYINSGTTYSGKNFVVTTSNPIILGTTSLSFVQSAGGFTVSPTTSGNVLTANGTSNSATSQPNMTFNGTTLAITGAITATGDITAFASDERLKTNTLPIQSPVDKILKINGYYFSWNELAQSLFPVNRIDGNVGFIAQEIEKVLPEIIRIAPFDDLGDGTSKTGENYLTVQYDKIVPLLVEAIKELKNEIEQLKNKS
jgi:hypothetical protein